MMQGKLRMVWSSIFAGSLIFLVCPAWAIELVAHEATYQMSLLSSSKDAQMTAVAGKTSFLLKNDCAGWISSEDYLLEFAYETGDTAILASHFESWEQLNGHLYSFEVDERSTFDEEKQFTGYASLPPESDRPAAYFSMQPDVAISLPESVYFPLAHVRAMLERAEKGETLFSADIFFGAEPDRALKKTNTVIGAQQQVKNQEILGPLALKKYYPVQIAYFDPSSVEAVPEYEITFHIQPNGVVAYYEVDYGSFAIDAVLTEAKPINRPEC
jgi:hypothetical protein